MHDVLAGISITLCVVIGLGLALFTLPGVWFMLLAASLINGFWTPGLLSWWTIGICAFIALIGEVVEVIASALGAKKFGGTNMGALGSVLGALIGALLGSFVIPIPILGTILGAVLGAGLGAIAFEKGVKKRTWAESGQSGAGAALGRLVATIAKLGVAVVVGLVLILAACIPGV